MVILKEATFHHLAGTGDMFFTSNLQGTSFRCFCGNLFAGNLHAGMCICRHPVRTAHVRGGKRKARAWTVVRVCLRDLLFAKAVKKHAKDPVCDQPYDSL